MAVFDLAGEVLSILHRGFAKGWLLVSGIVQEPARPPGSQDLGSDVVPGSTEVADVRSFSESVATSFELISDPKNFPRSMACLQYGGGAVRERQTKARLKQNRPAANVVKTASAAGRLFVPTDLPAGSRS